GDLDDYVGGGAALGLEAVAEYRVGSGVVGGRYDPRRGDDEHGLPDGAGRVRRVGDAERAVERDGGVPVLVAALALLGERDADEGADGDGRARRGVRGGGQGPGAGPHGHGGPGHGRPPSP